MFSVEGADTGAVPGSARRDTAAAAALPKVTGTPLFPNVRAFPGGAAPTWEKSPPAGARSMRVPARMGFVSVQLSPTLVGERAVACRPVGGVGNVIAPTSLV